MTFSVECIPTRNSLLRSWAKPSVFRVEHLPGHAVSRKPETDKLIPQEMRVLREPHAIDILDEESQRFDLAEGPVELLVEEVDLVRI